MVDVESNILPPGWELKYDRRTGKHYYMNYITKMTSWEDPRIRNKSQQANAAVQQYPIDFVAQQPGHGSPYHVYPYPSPMPLQHAFQNSSYSPSNVHTFSPKALPKQITELGGRSHGSPLSGGSPILGQKNSATPKGSPVPSRVSSLTNKLQDTSITLTNDVEASVAKISSMFPTVSETHIKILLKKYYNREAVVISALQVEKHPISTPGPFSTPPTGASRLQTVAAGVYAGVQLARGASPTPPYGSSPRGSPPLRPQSGASGTGSPLAAPVPHSSPKMKLRYLKGMFPKVDETLILDVLAGEDNNVQKASEKLLTMGYAKKENTFVKNNPHHKEAENAKPPSTPPVPVQPKPKTAQEKEKLKDHLQKKYASIPERVVAIALESVGWSEDRAEQILSAVLQEDIINKKPKETEEEEKNEEVKEEKTDTSSCNKVGALSSLSPTHVALQLNGSSICNELTQETIPKTEKANRRCKSKKEPTKVVVNTNTEWERGHQSYYTSNAKGPNPNIVKGAQDNLLLVDYVTWNGANPELKCGAKGAIRVVSKKNFDFKVNSLSRGPNKDNCKGPAVTPKGSIYQHIKSNNIPQMKVGGE